MKYTKNIAFPETRKIIEAVKYSKMPKRHTPNTNKQGHQTYENNQTGIKLEVIIQLINEMRILIQEMKTIRTVTENKQLSRGNSKTKDSPNQETQTKSNKENPKAPCFEVASIARSPQTFSYGEAIKKPSPKEQMHGTRLEKIDQEQPQERELPQQKSNLRPWKQWKRRMRPHI